MIAMLRCARKCVDVPKLVEIWFTGLALGGKDVLLSDEPQTSGVTRRVAPGGRGLLSGRLEHVFT